MYSFMANKLTGFGLKQDQLENLKTMREDRKRAYEVVREEDRSTKETQEKTRKTSSLYRSPRGDFDRIHRCPTFLSKSKIR